MDPAVLWRPSAERIAAARLSDFITAIHSRWQVDCPDYASLWRWSVAQPEAFWTSLWEQCGVIGERGPTVLENGERMPGARWFPQARLNYAENLLRRHDHADALVFWGEDKIRRRLSHAELYAQVSRCTQALQAAGIGQGDRVAAYLPNLPEALIAMLATTSLGAIWSSASPDFGVQGVLDRFGQIEPKVLLCVDGYWYNCKPVDFMAKTPKSQHRSPVSPGRSSSPTSTIVLWRQQSAMACATPTSSPPLPPTKSNSRRCLSHIRYSSCSPRVPPAFPSASCTVMGAPCCNISRNTSCTVTSSRTTASSISPPAAG